MSIGRGITTGSAKAQCRLPAGRPVAGPGPGIRRRPQRRTPHLDRLATQSVVLTTAVSTCPGLLAVSRQPDDRPLPGHARRVRQRRRASATDAVSLAQAFAGGRVPTPPTSASGTWTATAVELHPAGAPAGFRVLAGPANARTTTTTRSTMPTPTNKRSWKGYDAEAQTDEARDYIQAHGNEKPFLLVLSWGPPHNPYETAPERFRKRFKPEEIQLRPNVPAEKADAGPPRSGRLLRPLRRPRRVRRAGSSRRSSESRHRRRHDPGLHLRPRRHARLARRDAQAAALGRVDPGSVVGSITDVQIQPTERPSIPPSIPPT